MVWELIPKNPAVGVKLPRKKARKAPLVLSLPDIRRMIVKLGLPKGIDFRSFRTMHCSLMLRTGARPEVTRDNMGHVNIDVTQNVYGRSWWEEGSRRLHAQSMPFFSNWSPRTRPLSQVIEKIGRP